MKEKDFVTGVRQDSSPIVSHPSGSGNSDEHVYYALDSKQPFLNGRGHDLRRKYCVLYEVGGVKKTISIVAAFMADAYKVYENVLGKPEPEIIKIWSEPFNQLNSTPNDAGSAATGDAQRTEP